MVVGICVVVVVVIMANDGVRGFTNSKFNFWDGVIGGGILVVNAVGDWVVYGRAVGKQGRQGADVVVVVVAVVVAGGSDIGKTLNSKFVVLMISVGCMKYDDNVNF